MIAETEGLPRDPARLPLSIDDLEYAAKPIRRHLRRSPPPITKLVAAGEIALGAALVLPVVPTAVAATGLAAFSTGLLGLYLRVPGMRRQGSLRPTANGIALAKDVWMLGIAADLLIDELTRHR